MLYCGQVAIFFHACLTPVMDKKQLLEYCHSEWFHIANALLKEKETHNFVSLRTKRSVRRTAFARNPSPWLGLFPGWVMYLNPRRSQWQVTLAPWWHMLSFLVANGEESLGTSFVRRVDRNSSPLAGFGMTVLLDDEEYLLKPWFSNWMFFQHEFVSTHL